MSKPKKEDLPYRPCVGVVLFNYEGKVWAGHRIPTAENTEDKDGETRLWQFPQGGIDKGEDPLAAGKRELWEETGVTSASLIGEVDEWLKYDLPDELIGIGLKGKYRGQTQKWYAFRFDGNENEINITEPPDGAPQEFDDWAWRDITEMPGLIVEFKREIYERVVLEFRSYAGG